MTTNKQSRMNRPERLTPASKAEPADRSLFIFLCYNIIRSLILKIELLIKQGL